MKAVLLLTSAAVVTSVSAFASTPIASLDRRNAGRAIAVAGASFSLPDWLGRAGASTGGAAGAAGNTNEVVKTVAGIRHRRLGSGDIIVSELGMGTQRWGGADFNSPGEDLCHMMLDLGTANGINLVDTAEQYPIPSDRTRPEGMTEEIIGNWLAKDKSRRQNLVIATKITGGSNITPKNIIGDCEGSLRRLQTDYIDVYNLHWPARYTPQSNWGQSLEYNHAAERARYYRDHASFDEIVMAMGKLIEQGKIRGYGSCNDNAVGLMGMAAAAKRLGVPGPCTMQGDYSVLNRRSEENGLSEASSPELENCGWMVMCAHTYCCISAKCSVAVVPRALGPSDPTDACTGIQRFSRRGSHQQVLRSWSASRGDG